MLSLKSPATDTYASCSVSSVWMHAARLAATVVLENAGLDPRNGLPRRKLGTCAALL